MIQRARLFFFVALLVAGVVLVTNFPLTSLLHDRSTLGAENHQLAGLRAANDSLSAQVNALKSPATVGQIAHQDYGLVSRGQRSVVVLPGPPGSAGGGGASGPLANGPVPSSDLLPSDSILAPSVPSSSSAPSSSSTNGGHGRSGPGFWGRVMNRLEFWKSVF